MKLWFITVVIWLACIVFCGIGYIMNIVKLIGADTFGMLELARAIGIAAAPVGVFLGFI